MAGSAAWVVFQFVFCARAEGRGAVVLPKLERTAQNYALGEGGAHLKGLNALGSNPAGLSVARPEVLAQYQQSPMRTSLGLFGLAYPLQSVGATLGLSYMSLRSAAFDRRNDRGEATGSFDTQDQMLGLHMSRPLRLEGLASLLGAGAGSLNPIDVGLGLKYLHMGIDGYSGSGYVADAGLRYAARGAPVTVGLAALNLGRGPVFLGKQSAPPTRYALSIAWRALGLLTLVGGVSRHAAEGIDEAALGLEYGLGNVLFLRGRFSLLRGGPGGRGGALEHVLSNQAAGFGLNLMGQTLDYSFQPLDGGLREAGAAGIHRMTLVFRFARAPGRESARPARADAVRVGLRGGRW